MDLLDIREYCLFLDARVEECEPFGPDHLVFKIEGKMFALIDIRTCWMALKCDPEHAVELRERYEYVTPAYHFNKKHWNGIDSPQARGEQLRAWIDHSFDLVRPKTAKKTGRRPSAPAE